MKHLEDYLRGHLAPPHSVPTAEMQDILRTISVGLGQVLGLVFWCLETNTKCVCVAHFYSKDSFISNRTHSKTMTAIQYSKYINQYATKNYGLPTGVPESAAVCACSATDTHTTSTTFEPCCHSTTRILSSTPYKILVVPWMAVVSPCGSRPYSSLLFYPGFACWLFSLELEPLESGRRLIISWCSS